MANDEITIFEREGERQTGRHRQTDRHIEIYILLPLDVIASIQKYLFKKHRKVVNKELLILGKALSH